MHREIEAMKEAVAGDQKVALELEQHPGMVGLGDSLGEGFDGFGSVGCVFFFVHNLRSGTDANCCCSEQHLMLPPPFVPSTASSSTVSTAIAAPSISSLILFADLSLRSPVITSLLCNSPVIATQQHPPRAKLRQHQRGLWSRFRQMARRRLLLWKMGCIRRRLAQMVVLTTIAVESKWLEKSAVNSFGEGPGLWVDERPFPKGLLNQ